MSDELPEEIKRRLMERLLRKASVKKQVAEKTGREDPEKIVWSRLGDEKARELMYKTKIMYPAQYPLVIKVFHELLRRGEVEEFDGYTTLLLLRQLGIYVKPSIRLKFVKHGKEVSFKDYAE